MLFVHFGAAVLLSLAHLCYAIPFDGSRVAPLCTTRACVVRAGRLLNSIDAEKNPCTEFADFSCGGIFNAERDLGLDSSKGTAERTGSYIQAKLDKVFTDKDRIWTPGAPETKAQLFYDNCKRSWFKIAHGRELLHSLAVALGVPELYQRTHNELTAPTPTTFGGALRVLREQFGVRMTPSLLRIQLHGKCFNIITNADLSPIGTDMDLSVIDFFASPQEKEDLKDFAEKYEKITSQYMCKDEKDVKFNDTTLGFLHSHSPNFGWKEFLNVEDVNSDVEVSPCVPDLSLYFSAIMEQHPKMTKKFLIATAMKNLWTRKEGENADTQCFEMMKRYFIEVSTAIALNKGKVSDVGQVSRMAEQARRALHQRFSRLEWLDSATREVFVEKLMNLRFHMACNLLEVSGEARAGAYLSQRISLAIQRGNALSVLGTFPGSVGFPTVVEDVEALYEFHAPLQLTGRLPKDLMQVARWREHMSASRCDLDMWDINIHPLLPNAFNMPSLQSVAVSLGQMGADQYDQRLPSVFNYAGLGATIGHEVMHSFDNNGRKMDRWTENVVFAEATKEYFENGEQCLMDYYSSLERRGVHVNGTITIGENIADIYGLELAYEAWHEEMQSFGPDPRLPGVPYTPDQLFFIAFGQANCDDPTKWTLEALLTDPHAPGYARVTGSVVQTKQFADAFSCHEDPTYDDSVKCKLW